MQNHRQALENGGAWTGKSNYIGETIEDNFLILLGQNRDSDCLTRSNFTSALIALGGESEQVQIHRFGHWACGWFEYLVIDSDNKDLLIQAQTIESDLDDYPVVDEEHWSELEMNEAQDVWKNCFNSQERIDYIRQNKSQFEPRDFQDLIACVRGEYFLGYASELLN